MKDNEIRVDADRIPSELRERTQWVCWRRAQRNGRQTKVLKRTSGQNADATDPRSWTTFRQALAAAENFDDIGYVFAADDPFTGVDLDGVLSEDGELHPSAAAIVSRLDGYSERSPSRRGVHVLVRAELNGFPHNRTSKTAWGGEFEVYDCKALLDNHRRLRRRAWHRATPARAGCAAARHLARERSAPEWRAWQAQQAAEADPGSGRRSAREVARARRGCAPAHARRGR